MNDFLNLVKKRKSIRAYKENKLEEEKLLKILEAGRLAPSAKNLQEWKFIVIKDEKLIKELVPICKNQAFVGEASVVIVGCSEKTDYVMTCGQNAYSIDLAISIDHMSLMAAYLGIGSCWIGAFYEDKLKNILDIPNDVKVVSLLTLGYPLEDLKIEEKPRNDLNSFICENKWCF
jgi:nitroreductase